MGIYSHVILSYLNILPLNKLLSSYMYTNGNVLSPKRETSVWHFDAKVTSCMSIKCVLFLGLERSQEQDCLLMRIALVCKGLYAVPVKSNVFLFLSVSCLPFAFSSLLYWSDVLLPKLIPRVIDQPFKKSPW